MSFNGNSWSRAREFLEQDSITQLEAGRLPIVCGQEHKLDEQWLGECSASQRAKGWKVVGSPCHTTDKLGHSGGVYLAVPQPVELRKATGQQHWDISPAGSPGRACMALMKVRGNSWLLLFSLYLWTGQAIGSPANAAILQQVVTWITRLGLCWVVGADWQNTPDQLEDSCFNAAVRGVVLAPKKGTCRSKGSDRTIDFFWVDRRIAGTCGEATVADAPFAPHKPVVLSTQQPWDSYQVRVLWQPKQFPLNKPMGAPRPPQAFPDVDLDGGQEHLDRVYEGFCAGAEAELCQLFDFDDETAKQHTGRGRPPKFVLRPLMTPVAGACAAQGATRAWRWLAQELAWLQALYSCWLTNPHDRLQYQMRLWAAWSNLMKWQSHWAHLGAWSYPLWQALTGLWQWRGVTTDLLAWLEEVHSWAHRTAAALERRAMRQKEEQLKARLEEQYPGSGGLLHRICKWRTAWTPRRGSVSKQLLCGDPQEVVQGEEEDWAGIWKVAQQKESALWRSCPAEARRALPPLEESHLRAICKSYRERAGLGGCAWHPRHWSWLSSQALQCLAQLLVLCERCGAWPTAIQFLVLMLLAKEDGWGQAGCPHVLVAAGVGRGKGAGIPRVGQSPHPQL